MKAKKDDRCVVKGCMSKVAKEGAEFSEGSFRCPAHSARYYGKATLIRPGVGGGRRKPRIHGEGYSGESIWSPSSNDTEN